MKKIISILILLVLALAYWLISPLWRVKHVNDTAPMEQAVEISATTSATTPAPTNNLSGTFTNGAHNVSGTARVVDTATGKILRFENFKTLNGPDLHIYLATDKTAKDFVEVSVIKGTEGNINYDLPADVDLNKYNHVLIWCKTFTVLFGEAVLK